jgi:hypothetical protein
MIDIQPHLDKLELLREYMDLFIDDKVRKAITPPKTTITMFGETGMLMMPNHFVLPSFESWIQLNNGNRQEWVKTSENGNTSTWEWK